MKLELKREIFTAKSTIGRLFIDSVFECWTLEDNVHGGPKVKGETAIPEGTYNVTIERSPRFARMVPRLHDVPGFDGILIHWGNTDKDTSGCILVGMSKNPKGDQIDTSRREFFDRLMPKLNAAVSRGESLSITISSPVATPVSQETPTDTDSTPEEAPEPQKPPQKRKPDQSVT